MSIGTHAFCAAICFVSVVVTWTLFVLVGSVPILLCALALSFFGGLVILGLILRKDS